MSYNQTTLGGVYGFVAEFDSPESLVAAAEKARHEGYKKMDAYSPFPIHELSDAIGFKDVKVPWIVFLGGLTGMLAGYTLQWWTSVIDYPLNVGGRPLNSVVAFIPVTYECTILFAAFGGALGMLALNGFPKPYHSIFNTPGFERASQDRFFLAIEANDPRFDAVETKKFLETLDPIHVAEVEA
ncbi:MAG: DUF3341 domain-containing protein [Fimbriimonas sp.]